MRKLLTVIFVVSLLGPAWANAADNSSLDTEFSISLELSELDNLSLGDDPGVDRLVTEEYEFEFDLVYTVNDQVYLFFAGSLNDETETIKPIDIEEEDTTGFERKEIGVGIYFGEEIDSELKIGRFEITSTSAWWLWWEEELDAISLESAYSDFEILLGIAEEQARESTDEDFIDPEIDGIRRIFASLSWEFATDQSLNFYYLDQKDNSDSFNVGELEDFDKIDEEDADLTWAGISYLGGFEVDSVGEIEVEVHVAEVRGDETLYEFDDPDGNGNSEVEEKEKQRVSGTAESFLLGWRPAQLEGWNFWIGKSRGSGDSNPDDKRNESFRQNELQGDSEIYGELFQPEISNIVVQAIGVEWQVYEGVEIALTSFDYEQVDASDEIRDASLEIDPTGSSRDLGSEIDLVLTIEAYDGLELILVAAEFDAGRAYGASRGETSRFVSFELSYDF